MAMIVRIMASVAEKSANLSLVGELPAGFGSDGNWMEAVME
jgi:hypothetical protein